MRSGLAGVVFSLCSYFFLQYLGGWREPEPEWSVMKRIDCITAFDHFFTGDGIYRRDGSWVRAVLHLPYYEGGSVGSLSLG